MKAIRFEIASTAWVLLWMWAAFYLFCIALPDGWVYEWYGYPSLLTSVAMLVGGVYLAHVATE